MKHSRLSCSSSSRFIACNASIQMGDLVPNKNRTSKAAAEGTVAHDCCDKMLNGGLADIHDIGTLVVEDGFNIEITAEMFTHAHDYASYVFGLGGEMYSEHWCSLKHLGIEGLDGGTTDAVVIKGSKMFIVDFKYGKSVPVEVVDNSQLQCYAVSKLHENPNVETVEMVIIQPRAYHKDGANRSWVQTKEQLLEWQNNTLIPAAKASIGDNPEFTPSVSNCRWCKGAEACPALHKVTMDQAIVDFDSIDDDLEPALVFPDVATLTVDQKTNLYKHRGLVLKFIEEFTKSIEREILEGSQKYTHVAKIVKRRSSRKIDTVKMLEVLGDEFSIDELQPRKTITLTELKKIYAGDLDQFTNKPDTGFTVVSVDDKRPEIMNTAQEDFK